MLIRINILNDGSDIDLEYYMYSQVSSGQIFPPNKLWKNFQFQSFLDFN